MAKYRILIGLMVMAILLASIPALAQEATDEMIPVAVVIPEIYDRGVAHFDAGDFEQALLDFNLFLLFNPTSSQGYYVMALSYINLEDVDNALENLDRALAIQPIVPELEAELHRVRAGIYGRQNELDNALTDLSAALDLAPDADTYFRRAMVYAALEDVDNALADFDSALELDDSNLALYVYRAYVYSTVGDLHSAAEDYYTFVGLIESDRTEGEALESGGVQVAELAPGIVLSYPVSVKADTYFSGIAVSADGTTPIDTLLILLDEDGLPLTADDDSGGNGIAFVQNFVIPTTGDYTVIVANSLRGGSGFVATQIYLTEEPFTN